MAKQKKALLPDVLERAVDCILDNLLPKLKSLDIPILQPVTSICALNGILDDAFIRRLDMSRAAGFGTRGLKKDHCILSDDGVTWLPNEALKAEILRIIECYENGKSYGPVFVCNLKDEPRAVAKVMLGKTRIFYITPFAYLIVQRMFLLPFYSLLNEFSYEFFTAIGVDMHRQANEVYDFLVEFSRNIMEGDYGGYDVNMPFDIGAGVNEIILAILAEFGYDEEQLMIVNGLLSDNLFPYISVLGDFFVNPGLQPSGKYATAEDNSLRGLLILVYVWMRNPHVSEWNFFDHVRPLTYGDDVLAAVSDEAAPYYHAVDFSRRVMEEVGLEFTTSAKGEVELPFVSIEDMSFLKRNFKFHDALGRVVAPLSLDSIFKTLEWRMPSKCVNEMMQLESMCNSSLREMFFHCKDEKQYSRCHSFLMQTLQSKYPKMVFKLPLYFEVLESLRLDEETGENLQPSL
jgi:hypothetical protein